MRRSAMHSGGHRSYMLQPLPGSLSALLAMPIDLFSLPTTWRRYWSCTGLCEADSVNGPRGLSIFALRSAAANSAYLPMSPFVAARPTASICAAS